MITWMVQSGREVFGFFSFTGREFATAFRQHSHFEQLVIAGTLCYTVGTCLFLFKLSVPRPVYEDLFLPTRVTRLPAVSAPAKPVIDYTVPAREEPDAFAMNTTMPRIGEGAASGSIHLYPFRPKKDLVRVEDSRVWWESENDDHTNDVEDDHVMHRAMETPFRRLVELVDRAGGTLKVQDAYRDEGIHSGKSLHKQGRALDLTAKDISLSKLARLCWAAGFDWVYYETRGGHHIHVSMRPE